MVAIELVPGAELPPDEGDAGGPDAPDVPRSRLRDTLRRVPRRRVIAAAAVAALALGAGVGVVAVRDHRVAARLATASGGVVALDHAPRARWRVELDHPRPVAVMRGLLVVAAQPADVSEGTDGITLEGVSLTDGRARWTTTVPGALTCGGGSALAEPHQDRVGTADELVCVTGTALDHVVVVGSDGTVTSTRPIEGRGADETLFPAPDGTLLRVEQDGSPSSVPGLRDGVLPYTLDGPLVTRGAQVSLEDAVTGGTVWQAVLEGRTAPAGTALWDAGFCLTGTGEDASLHLDLDTSPHVELGARTVWVAACGLDATLDLATGALLHGKNPFAPGYRLWNRAVQPLDGVGYAVELTDDAVPGGSGDVTSRLFRDDGTVVGDVPGAADNPWASDGTPATVVLTHRVAALSAFDAQSAAERWTTRVVAGTPLLARTASTVLLVSGDELVALDARTGRTRWKNPFWESDPDLGASAQTGPAAIFDVLTDGRRAVLVETLPDETGAPSAPNLRWTAFDLATGHVAWTATSTEGWPAAIAGHLVRLDPDAVVGLG